MTGDASLNEWADIASYETGRLRRHGRLAELANILREERDATIRALVLAGVPITRIAEEAGLSRQTIYNVAGDLLAEAADRYDQEGTL